jgi:hypothetical protein
MSFDGVNDEADENVMVDADGGDRDRRAREEGLERVFLPSRCQDMELDPPGVRLPGDPGRCELLLVVQEPGPSPATAVAVLPSNVRERLFPD